MEEGGIKRITEKYSPVKNYSVRACVCVFEKFPLFFSQIGSAFLLFASQSLLIQSGYMKYQN